MFTARLKLSGSYGDFLYTLSPPLYSPLINHHPLSEWFISLRLKKKIFLHPIGSSWRSSYLELMRKTWHLNNSHTFDKYNNHKKIITKIFRNTKGRICILDMAITSCMSLDKLFLWVSVLICINGLQDG